MLSMEKKIADERKRLQIIMEEGVERELKKQKEAAIKQQAHLIRED